MSKKLPLAHIELSKNNLIHNIKSLRSVTKKGTEIAVAIKGNAYGHGQKEISTVLDSRVDYFFVNSINELELLRKSSKKACFVLGYVENSDFRKAIKLGCILSLFSTEQLLKINEIAKKSKKIQEIHVPIEAYLGREGFLERELPMLFETIKNCKNIKLGGIYAHFANIEDTTNFTHAQKQINKFNFALKLAKKYGFNNLQTHISSTSGLLVYEKNKGLNNILRLGIGVYGLWPSEHIKFLYRKSKLSLKPVLSWKTKVAQIKTLPAGRTIGYGLTYTTHKETKVALIPQGYADGFGRELSNKGEVLIYGKRCKVLGRVAMNMFVVDVSHLESVKQEDEVVIIGKQAGEEITAEEMAQKANTINYEITTRLSAILPRIVV